MEWVKKLVDDFRQDRPHLKGGVVVIHSTKVVGWKVASWMNKLRDPQSWSPGCIAVHQDGRSWLAVGGNPKDGARKWHPHPKNNCKTL